MSGYDNSTVTVQALQKLQ